MLPAFLDRLHTLLRWGLSALTAGLYVVLAALVLLVFGGFLYAIFAG